MNDMAREEFEAWVKRYAEDKKYEYMPYLLGRHPETGEYNTAWVDSAWLGFSAAYSGTAAPLNISDWKWVEIPSSLKEHYAFEVLQDELAKAGVKVRP